MNKHLLLACCWIAALLLTQCKKNNDVPGADTTGYNKIDTTVSLDNGHISLSIPAGAMEEGTTVSLAPSNAEFPDSAALLQQFQLLPEGTKFKKPVRLTVHYDTGFLKNNDPKNIGIAFRYDKDGKWYAPMNGKVDTVLKTISVNIMHFSDWSIYTCMHLFVNLGPQAWENNLPLINTFTGQKAEMCVVMDMPPSWLTNEDVSDLITPLVPVHDPEQSSGADCPDCDLLAPLTAPPSTFDQAQQRALKPDFWYVNGVDHGNAQTGTVSGSGGNLYQYQAPDKIPANNPVAITAGIQTVKHGRIYIIQNVNVIGRNWKYTISELETVPCSQGHGSFSFKLSITATVYFHLDDQLNIVFDRNENQPATVSDMMSCLPCVSVTSMNADEYLRIGSIRGQYNTKTGRFNGTMDYDWHVGQITVTGKDNCSTGGSLYGGTIPGAPPVNTGSAVPLDIPAQDKYEKDYSADYPGGGNTITLEYKQLLENIQ